MMQSLTVAELKEAFRLRLLTREADLQRVIAGSYVSYAGLSLAGYFDSSQKYRVLLIGESEIGYLSQLPLEVKRERLEEFCSRKEIPCVVTSMPQGICDVFKGLAEKYSMPLLASDMPSTALLPRLSKYLRYTLAPQKYVHGVMMDVYGMGILITGKSGIGKSECALELVKRGHRLISDDVVLVKRIADDKAVGFCNESLRHHMEIRGVGLIDVRALFGIGAIGERKDIDLVVRLEQAVEGKVYERLGIEQRHEEILGVPIPLIEVPVIHGKNLSIVIEIAAMNQHLRMLGVNTARDFSNEVLRRLNPDLDNPEV